MKKTFLFLALAAYSSSTFSQISFIEKKEVKEEPKTFTSNYDSLCNIESAVYKYKSYSDLADFYGHLIGQSIIHVGGINKSHTNFLEITTKGKGKKTKMIETPADSPEIGSEFTVIDVHPKKTNSESDQRIILKEKVTEKKYIYDPSIGYNATEWIVKGYYEKIKQLYMGKQFYYINTRFLESQRTSHLKYYGGLFDMETNEQIENIKDFSKWKCVDVSIKIDTGVYSLYYIKSCVVLVFENEERYRYYAYLQTHDKQPLMLDYSSYRRRFKTGDDVLIFGNIWREQDIALRILYADIDEKEILAGRFLNEEQYQKLSESIKKLDEMKAQMDAGKTPANKN